MTKQSGFLVITASDYIVARHKNEFDSLAVHTAQYKSLRPPSVYSQALLFMEKKKMIQGGDLLDIHFFAIV